MGLQVLIQTFINGISSSLIYVLFALGLTLIVGIFNTFNFAHAEFVMIAGFVTYFVVNVWKLPYAVSFIMALTIVSMLGIIFEKSIFFPMRRRPSIQSSLATYGAVGFLQTGALIIWGGNVQGVKPLISGQFHFGSLVFPLDRLPVVIGALLMLIILFLFIQRTKMGLAIRAVQQDEEAASLQGINVARVRIVVWVVASSLAGAAGILLAPISYVDPFMGNILILKGFAIVILGGLGSIPGALIAGFILGFVDSFGMTYLGTYSYMFAFGIIILVLLFRPQGLMGRRS
jgi:branched-chain amino acid transport system permease protein